MDENLKKLYGLKKARDILVEYSIDTKDIDKEIKKVKNGLDKDK